MSTLTGKTIAETYKDLLQISNNNVGIDSTLRPIEDGEGTAACIQISESEFAVIGTTTLTGSVNVTGNLIATAFTGVGSGLTGLSYTQLADKPTNISEFINDAGYLLPGQGGSWIPVGDDIVFSRGDAKIGSSSTSNNKLVIASNDYAAVEFQTAGDSYTSRIYLQDKVTYIGDSVGGQFGIDIPNKVLQVFGTNRGNFDTSGRFALGANDWSSLTYEVINGWGTSSHNVSAKGLEVVGEEWIGIQTRIPIDPEATYAVSVRVKKLVTGGKFFTGVESLDSALNLVRTDGATSLNWGTAEGIGLDTGDGTVTYTSTYKGHNTASESDDNKFDPGGELFDIVIICNWGADSITETDAATLIEAVEVEKISHSSGAIYDGTVTAEAFAMSDGTPVGGADIWSENGSDIHYSTGNVGIGTDDPQTKLHVSGLASCTGLIVAGPELIATYASLANPSTVTIDRRDQNPTDSALTVSRYDTSYDNRPDAPIFNILNGVAGGTEIFRIQGDGAVGIGTASPVGPLHVIQPRSSANTINLTRDVDILGINNGASSKIEGGALAGPTPSMGAAVGFCLLDSDGTGSVGNTEGYLYFETKDSGGGLSEKMKITSTGNVGIGTSTPVAKLDVAGQIVSLPGAVSAPSFSFSGDTNTGISRPTDDAVNIVTGGEERMRITSAGMVGIGTTSPATKLDLNEVAGTKDVIQSFSKGGEGKARVGLCGATSQVLANALANDLCIRSDGHNIRFGTASATRTDMTILSNGNVGIGTDNPGEALTIQGYPALGLRSEDGNTKWKFFPHDNGSLYINDETSTKITIDNAGYVGIGTGNPSQKLEIAGNLHVDGDISYTGTTTVINAQSLAVEDKNIILGEVTTPTDITGDGGGIILRAASDKTFIWDKDSDAWVSNTNLDVIGQTVNLYNSSGSSIFIAKTGANSVAGVASQTPTGDWFYGVGKVEQDGFDIYDNSADASRIHIDPDGKVGIGVEDPDTELHVSGTIKNSGDILTNRIFIDSPTDYPLVYFRDSSNTSLGWLGMREDNTSQLAFPQGQDFNIYALDVAAQTTRKLFSLNDTGTVADLTIEDGSIKIRGTEHGRGRVSMQATGNEWEWYPHATHFGLYNRTTDKYAFRFDNNNNVQIGESAPSGNYRLEVKGNTHVDGTMDVTSAVDVTDTLTADEIVSRTMIKARQVDGNLLPVYQWYDHFTNVNADNYGNTTGGHFSGLDGSKREWIDDFPTGKRELVWVDVNDPAQTSMSGGWNGGAVAVDHTKMYRSVVLFKFTHFQETGVDADPGTPGTQGAGLFYHGSKGYDGTGGSVGLRHTSSGATDTNPYFASGVNVNGGVENNTWYISVGYIHPSNIDPAMFDKTTGGIYKAETGERILQLEDFQMLPTVAAVTHRTYNYYDRSPDNIAYFARPRLEECNGSEPSLEELLSDLVSEEDAGNIGRHNFPGQVAIGKKVVDITNNAKLDVDSSIDVVHPVGQGDPIIRARSTYVNGTSTSSNGLVVASYGTTWGTSLGMDISSESGSLILSTGGPGNSHQSVLTLDSSNHHVGIGTRYPALQVASSYGLHISNVSNTGNQAAELRLSGGTDFSLYAGSGAFIIRDNNRTPNDKLIINSTSGYIGFNESSPTCPVHIKGLTLSEDANDLEPYIDLMVETPDNHGGIGINASGGDQAHLRFMNAGVEKWQWRCPFHYSDSTSLGYENSNTLRAYSWDVGKDVLTIGQISDNHLSTGGDSGYGGLGINTVPVHALDVVGDAHISGTLTASEVVTNTQTNLNIIDKEITAAYGATTESAMHLGGIKLGTGAEQKTWIYDKDVSTNGSWVSNTSIKCNDKLVVTDGSGPDDWLFPIDLTRSSSEVKDGSNLYSAAGSPVIGMKNLDATAGNILGGLEFEGNNWYGGSVYCKADSHVNRAASIRIATRGGPSSYKDRLTVDSSGKVGIGTTTPSHELTVVVPAGAPHGGLRLIGHPGIDNHIRYDNPSGSDYWLAGTDYNYGPNDFLIWNSVHSHKVPFRIDAESNKTVVSSLDVGSDGWKDSETGRLRWGSENGSSAFAYSNVDSQGLYIEQRDDGSGKDSIRLQTRTNNSGNYTTFNIDASTETFTFNNGSIVSTGDITTTGNVGIGTTSPNEKLDVQGKIYIESQGVDWNETTPGLVRGALHFDPVGDGASNTGNAITFGASDSSVGTNANAGIYTRSDASYGTKMYFATTDRYALGSKTRMMIDYNGNVGIGTNNPGAKLEVSDDVSGAAALIRITNEHAEAGSTDETSDLEFWTATNTSPHRVAKISSYKGGDYFSSNTEIHGGLTFWTQSSTGTPINSGYGERMRIDSSGNVGIGVVPATDWLSSQTALQIDTTGSLSQNGGPGGRFALALNAKQTGGNYITDWEYQVTDEASAYIQAHGSHAWWSAASGTADTAITWSQAMTLDASGNLGIGTSSPIASLSVLRASAASSLSLRHTASGNGYGYLVATTGTTTNDLVISSEVNGSATERMRIDSSGNVGIGTTSPATALHVKGGTNANVMIVDATGTAANYIFDVRDDGTSKFRVDPSGNVGIGTDTPVAALDVYRPDEEISEILIRGGAQGTGKITVGQSATFGGGMLYNGDNSPDQTGDADRITFFRRNGAIGEAVVFSYAYNSSAVDFEDNIKTPAKVTGGSFAVDGVGDGVSGSYTTADNKTVTVTNGLITDISPI